MNECSRCGKSYKIGFKDKMLRKQVSFLSRMYPDLKSQVEEAKDYCNTCYAEVVEPTAKAHLGKFGYDK